MRPLRERTTPLDALLAMRWSILPLLVALPLTAWCLWGFATDAAAHHTPAAPLGLLFGAFAWIAFGIFAAGFRSRLHEIRRGKALRWVRGGRRVIVKPSGEHVSVYTYDRRWPGDPLKERFHAETDAERAMEYVRKQRERTPEEAAPPTSEARALARVLAGKKG